MSGRAPDRGGNEKRPSKKKGSPRVAAGGREAETYVEAGASAPTVAHDDGLFVDDNPKRKKNGAAAAAQPKNGRAAPNAPTQKRAPAPPASPAPPVQPAAKKKGSRAAEKRRARGDAPVGQADGTQTALNQRQQAHDESGALKYALGSLTCVKGPEQGLALNLLEGRYTIGRGRDNSFVLKDIAASRKHVRIDVQGGRITASDMGSGNGTRVNGRAVQSVVLDDGDKLEIGNSVLVFRRIGSLSSSASTSRPHTSGDGAKERIEKAAEQLAAELSERLRDDFDEPSGNGRTNNDRPRTGVRPGLGDERKKPRPPMPDELWNDAETHVPLSEIVPADAPLGAQKQGPSALRSEQTPSVDRMQTKRKAPPPSPPRAAPPRAAQSQRPRGMGKLPSLDDLPPPGMSRETPAPVPLPPRVPTTLTPRAARAHGVAADAPSAAPTWTYVVLPALVVVLLLGSALGGWALYRFVKESQPAPAVAERERTLREAEAQLQEGDLDGALKSIERVLAQNPSDISAKLLKQEIERAKGERDDAPPAPVEERAPAPVEEAQPPPPPSAPPPVPVEDKEPPEEKPAPAAVEPAAAAPPPEPTAPQPPPPQPPPPAAEPEKAKASSSPAPKKREKERAAPAPRRERAKREAPAARGGSMSDEQAGKLYREAVSLVREENEKKGCALLVRVARDAPRDSNWKVKAESALGRYSCE